MITSTTGSATSALLEPRRHHSLLVNQVVCHWHRVVLLQQANSISTTYDTIVMLLPVWYFTQAVVLQVVLTPTAARGLRRTQSD